MNFINKHSFLLLTLTSSIFAHIPQTNFCVIGFGPAGIYSTCALIDRGISPQAITVIDKDFCGGRFGKYYQEVRLITTHKHNMRYFCSSPTLHTYANEYLEQMASTPHALVMIKEFVSALHQISDKIFTAGVHKFQTEALAIDGQPGAWKVITQEGTIECSHIILAQGWEPKKLNYPHLEEISLDFALSPKTLKPFVNKNDRVAVFGNGRSSKLAIQALLDLGITEITSIIPAGNFAEQGAQYAAHFEDEELLVQALSDCNKAIYAIGYHETSIKFQSQSLKEFSTNSQAYAPGIIRIRELGVYSTARAVQESFDDWLSLALSY